MEFFFPVKDQVQKNRNTNHYSISLRPISLIQQNKNKKISTILNLEMI